MVGLVLVQLKVLLSEEIVSGDFCDGPIQNQRDNQEGAKRETR